MLKETWEVAFPQNSRTISAEIQGNSFSKIGVVVHRISSTEARFIIRGNLKSNNDLINCLLLAERLATSIGCHTLVTQEKVPSNWLNANASFKIAGFELTDESWVFSGPFLTFAERIKNTQTLLLRKNVIPKNTRTTNLIGYHDQIKKLLHDHEMMDDFDFDYFLHHSSSQSISSKFSQIVWCNNKIVGVILVSSSVEIGVYYIPIRYVIPEFRQTWVNVLLIAECVKHGPTAGAEIVRFEANLRTHKETISLAKKTGCKPIGTFNRYRKFFKNDTLLF